MRANLDGEARADFDQAMALVEAAADADLNPDARGLAVFARGPWGGRFCLSMQFAVPLANALTCYRSPDVFPLLELMDTYDRYLLVVVQPDAVKALEVNLGAPSVRAWAATPQAARRSAPADPAQPTAQGMPLQAQARLVERLLRENGRAGLILAGQPELARCLAQSLRPATANRLIGVIPAKRGGAVDNAVAQSLDRFVEFEENESQRVADRVLRARSRGGPAVTGERACLRALREGQADTIVFQSGYRASLRWACADCDHLLEDWPRGDACPQCGSHRIEQIDPRIELARLAAQQGVAVKVVESAAGLRAVGGVGCLLLGRGDQPGLPAQAASSRLRRVA